MGLVAVGSVPGIVPETHGSLQLTMSPSLHLFMFPIYGPALREPLLNTIILREVCTALLEPKPPFLR